MDSEETGVNENSKLSVSSKITFKIFSNLLEQINKIDDSASSNRSIPKNEEKKRTLEKFYELWRSTAKKLKSSDEIQVDDSYFTVIRFLLPASDRRVYGLKESKLSKYLIEALCIAPKSDDALKLINYKAPTCVKSEGDFASVAYFILKNRCQETSTLTIEEINKHLDIIAFKNAQGKEGLKEVNKSIKHLLVSLSAMQLKWLIRIILKDLKIGIRETVIFESFHPDAMDLYNYTSSLEKVCSTLTDPKKRLNEIGVSVFTPCRPMLGEKAKPSKIESLLNGREFYIETKFDGERFQLHKKGSQYMYFSRNSHDYTEMFGADIYSGSLTPYIHSLFNNDVTDLILDGEMCTYSIKEKMILSLPEEHSKSKNQLDDIQTCFCVFDILLYNDAVLTNKPLRKRSQFIEKAFKEMEGRLIVSHRELANSNQQVVEALNKAIDTRLEGIVVKDPDSVYKPSVRSGSGWYKVKPDYMLGLNDDLDCVIVGGYYGTGKRSGILSHFLVAVAVDDQEKKFSKESNIDDDLDFFNEDAVGETNESISEPKSFYSFAKIGSGYTHKELKDFNEKLANKWTPFDKKNPPKSIFVGSERPDVWIEPRSSMIIQIKAVEITQTDKYKTGLTLRFPRLEKFRPDKPWYDCMKLSELKELFNKNEGRLASGKHFDLEDYDEEGNLIDENGEPIIKKKKVSNTGRAKATVSARFKGIDPLQVDKITDIFIGKEFCVVLGTEKYSKPFIEQKIIEFGGEIVQNPSSKTYCIITGKLIHKINNYIKKDLYDVVKLDWIMRCVQDKKFHSWKPSDMLHSRIETKDYFDKIFDPYGDSYENDVTPEELKKLFMNMKSSELNVEDTDEKSKLKLRHQIACIENTYFPNESFQFGLFRLDFFYVDFYHTLNTEHERIANSSLDLIELRLRWHGGAVNNCINEDTTHIIVDETNLERLDEMKQINRKRRFKFHIVKSNWVIKSIDAEKKLDELAFHI